MFDTELQHDQPNLKLAIFSRPERTTYRKQWTVAIGRTGREQGSAGGQPQKQQNSSN
jgi:hypothetical protein